MDPISFLLEILRGSTVHVQTTSPDMTQPKAKRRFFREQMGFGGYCAPQSPKYYSGDHRAIKTVTSTGECQRMQWRRIAE